MSKGNRKIRLCLIGNLASPQNQVLLKNLKNKNLEIHFISTTRVNYPGIEVYYLKKYNFTFIYFLLSLKEIRKIIKKIQPDVVHAQDLVIAGIWAYLSGFKPYIATVWGSDVLSYSKFIWVEKFLIRKTLEHAEIVTGPAEHLGKAAQKIAKKKLPYLHIHFGVDIAKYLSIKSAKFKENFKNKKIIFCPRAIAPIYNTDILVEAFKIVNQKMPCHLVLLGKNSNLDYLIKIEKLLIKYDLLDNVSILPGINQEKMIDIYNSSDLVVSVTSSDGGPSTFLEALLLGKKILVTNLDFTKEWPDITLFKVPVGDIKTTANEIIKTLKIPEDLWKKQGKKNSKIMIEKADASKNADILFEKYNKL